VLRALHKDPARRYASVQELSDDVRRHLEGRPVRARADTLGYRAGKFVRRNRVAVAAATLVMLVLVAGILATVREQRIAEAHRARAEARFADVRRLANEFLFEFEEAIHDLPGATPARPGNRWPTAVSSTGPRRCAPCAPAVTPGRCPCTRTTRAPTRWRTCGGIWPT